MILPLRKVPRSLKRKRRRRNPMLPILRMSSPLSAPRRYPPLNSTTIPFQLPLLPYLLLVWHGLVIAICSPMSLAILRVSRLLV
jgi:hypothetical protein